MSSKNESKGFFKYYYDIRMLKILLLGVISGFPWVIIGSSLSLWLKEEGLSRSTIGWAGLIFAVYALNYLWAPLIDRIRIPYLTTKFKNIRSTILLKEVINEINSKKFFINNIDVNIICETPKISPLKRKLIKTISKLCNIGEEKINIKGKTTEKLGIIGKERAIACETIASVIKYV